MPAPSAPRVLVVDDEDAIQQLIRMWLEDAGYDVVTAADGAEGLNALRGDAAIGLVLLDLMMPRFDGWRFRHAQSENAALARVPTVIVTGVKLTPAAREELNARDVIEKPMEREHLLAIVATHCLQDDSGRDHGA